MPIRIQRQRTKGWRAPEGAIYVGRGTAWGNRCLIAGPDLDGKWYVRDGADDYDPTFHPSRHEAHYEAVSRYRERLRCDGALIEQAKIALRGKSLMCFCPLDVPCHADILLEIANA